VLSVVVALALLALFAALVVALDGAHRERETRLVPHAVVASRRDLKKAIWDALARGDPELAVKRTLLVFSESVLDPTVLAHLGSAP
jgi:hypothetical protein